MKKSQLRNIIREEIINEQATGPSRRVGARPAHAPPGLTFINSPFENMTVDGATPTVGQIFEFSGTFGSPSTTNNDVGWWLSNSCPTYGAMNYFEYPLSQGTANNKWEISQVAPVYVPPNGVVSPLIDYTSTTQNPCTWAHFANSFLNPGIFPQCDIGCPPIVYGCTDPNAINYDPNANYQLTSAAYACEYGWRCKQLGDHPKFGFKCVQGNQNNPGTFATQQDCESTAPCITLHQDFEKALDVPFSPLTTDPQDMTKPEDEFGTLDIEPTEPDDEIKRMQDLANIR